MPDYCFHYCFHLETIVRHCWQFTRHVLQKMLLYIYTVQTKRLDSQVCMCRLCLDKNKIVLYYFVSLSVSHWMDKFEMITKEMLVFAPFFHVKNLTIQSHFCNVTIVFEVLVPIDMFIGEVIGKVQDNERQVSQECSSKFP